MRYEKPSQKLTFYKAFFSPQWKFLIHTILQCLSAKSTIWNEFSSTMASTIIFLATNKKFNFSKYIFEGMVKNVDSSVKFLMYPRRKQIKDTKIPQSSGPTEPIADEAANEENVPTQSNDPPLSRVNIHGSGEDRLKLKELIDLYTKLLDRVLDLETTKTAQAQEIASLKKRVKKLKRKGSLGDQEDASKQGRKIDDIDQDTEVTLVDETQGRYDDGQMFDTDIFNCEEVFVAEQSEKVVEKVVSTAKVSVAATITAKEITLAQALAELRSVKPKIVVQEPVLIALRAQEKRNKPPTKAQKKSTMSTYLKNMAGHKQSQLKNNSKRVGDELKQEKEKKQKIDDDQEETKMKKLIKVVPNEKEVAIDAIPLATKPSNIIYWKIVKTGKISLFQIIRANGSSKRYSSMIQMLRDFDSEDLETLWKLVKAKHGSTRPEEGYERVLWGDLRTMFEHNIEDTVWRNLLGNKVLICKLFDSYGVHFVRFQDMHLFMLVEKRYPLTPAIITEMLNKKLQTDHLNEMCYQLLMLMTKQLKKQ
ncbi:hypothetical protein Tco_0476234 [Tanacetum coccineum]